MVQIKGGETGAIVRERLIILILTRLKDFPEERSIFQN